MRWDEMGWGEVGWDGMRLDWMGWDEMAWCEMRWDGMGWGIVTSVFLYTRWHRNVRPLVAIQLQIPCCQLFHFLYLVFSFWLRGQLDVYFILSDSETSARWLHHWYAHVLLAVRVLVKIIVCWMIVRISAIVLSSKFAKIPPHHKIVRVYQYLILYVLVAG